MHSTYPSDIFAQHYDVAEKSITSFRNNGHVLLRGMLDEISAKSYGEIVRNAVHSHNKEKRKLEERDTYGKAFLQTTNLWEVDEQVRVFTFARRFAAVAAKLLGVEKVRLYHDQALCKEPGGGHTPWHQDQFYWPLDTHKTITMWMPLVDIDETMGVMKFASGSHHAGLYSNLEISDRSEDELNHYIASNGYAVTGPNQMKAGDTTWHNGWVMHAAQGNRSAISRDVMTIIYYADGARVIQPVNDFQEADRQRWLCGMEPGELAASKLNPIL